MATVDNLEIQIRTSADSTSAALDKLVQRLTVVEKSLVNVGNTSNSSFSNMKKMSTAFSSFSSMTNKSNLSVSSLTTSLSRMYLRIQALNKGFGTLSNSLNNSIDYFENLNYFAKAFEQVAQKADYSSFKEMGYASAEEYAASFMERANQLTAKMTGFSINKDGMLEDTGGVSLGLNPSDLITQQATFSQMASSMGTTSEQALKLSNVLTMLGADLASVKNMDFDKVWTDMQSGLAGMSRTMDKYGANIRLVNLQLLLNELGIEQTVSALNQNEKALLRTIAILDATRYSWGDLSETLNQPANQIRVLTANFENLGRMIGNLFVPMISKALPYINGLVIALQRLVSGISNFMGIDLSGITSSIGNVDISEILEIDDAEEGINDVTNAIKKLKTTTLGIDELNINAPQEDSGISSGRVGLGSVASGKLNDAFNSISDEYLKIWNEAFANMENKAQEFADRIEKIFEPITTPLKNLFKDISIGDWFSAGQNVSSITKGIFDLFTKAIKKVEWFKIGENIGKFLSGINWRDIISSAFDAVYETLKGILEGYFGSLSVAPLETAMISLLSISKLNFNKTTKGIKNLSTNLSKLQKTTIGATSVFVEFELLSDAFKDIATGSKSLSDSLGQIIFALVSSSATLTKMFGPTGTLISGFTAMASVLIGLDNAVDEILGKRAGEAIKNALTVPGGMSLEEISEKYSLLVNEISSGFLSINSASSNMKSTKSNIEEVWLQIEQIKVQMDAGVISVEEGTQKLETLFSELSKITETYIGDMEQSLIMAFGEKGAFRKYSDGLGEDISDSLLEAFNITGEMKNRVSELAGLMSDPNISTEEYISYQNEISSILGKTDELSKAITSFSENVSKLDLSDMFSEDGTLNAEKFRNSINSISQSVKDTNQEIDLAGQNIKTYLNTLREQAKTDEEIAAIDNLLSVVEESILNAKSDVKLQAVEFTNVIQADLIDGINDIISNAKLEGLSDSQIKDMVSRYIEGIEEAGTIISSEIEGSDWSDNITQSLLDELFYFDTVEVEGYIVSDSNVETVLAENYEEIVGNAIAEATENSKETFENSGEQSINSYIDGIALARSPLVNKANLLSNDTIKPFKNLESNFSKIGENSISKMKDGMVLSANSLYDECNKIVSNIQNIFGGATAGITMGLNAVVSKINIPQYAVGGFPEDGLFMANHNELVGQFSNGRTAVANNEQIIEGIKRGVAEANSEEIFLLRQQNELLMQLLDKDMSVNIGDREIARANARGQRSLGYALIT